MNLLSGWLRAWGDSIGVLDDIMSESYDWLIESLDMIG